MLLSPAFGGGKTFTGCGSRCFYARELELPIGKLGKVSTLCGLEPASGITCSSVSSLAGAAMSGPLERVLSRQVVACLDSNPAWSVDEVQSYLLKTHREYQRKPQTPLRSAISRALLNHRSQQSSPAPSNFVVSFPKQKLLSSLRQPPCISSG